MHVEIFSLCDAATNSHGKLNLLGTFDTIWARKLPASHQYCAIAVRLRFSLIEQGVHAFKINLVDQDGRLVTSFLDKKIPVNIKAPQTSGTLNLVLNIPNLKLPRYGAYSIALLVDGRPLMSLPLFIRQPPTQAK